MKTVWSLIKKEYLLFWSDKVAVSLTFLVPAVLIVLFGYIFGGLGNSASGINLAFLNNSNSKIAKKIESTLDTTKTFHIIKNYTNDEGKEVKFDTVSIKDFIRKGSASAALVVPEDAYSDSAFGLKLKFYYNPRNEMEMQIIQGLLQQTVMTQIPELFNSSLTRRSEEFLGKKKSKQFNKSVASLVSKYFGIDTSEILKNGYFTFGAGDSTKNDSTSKGAAKFFSSIVKFNKEQLVGKDVNNPNVTRIIGGYAMMFLLFTITASGASLFEEKQSGVTLRILTSPVSRIHILWSKYLYNISLGVLQLFTMFLFGFLFFGVDIFSNFINLFIVIICASAACTAFGMVLAAFSKTQAQARGLGTFLIITMSAIGGAWFPTFFLPSFIQSISKLTLVYWSMQGFMKVLWEGAGFMEILPVVGVLLLIAAIVNAVSIWGFKKGDVF